MTKTAVLNAAFLMFVILNFSYWNLFFEIYNPVFWKEQVVLVVGAACSRDHFISRLQAAPTRGFLW